MRFIGEIIGGWCSSCPCKCKRPPSDPKGTATWTLTTPQAVPDPLPPGNVCKWTQQWRYDYMCTANCFVPQLAEDAPPKWHSITIHIEVHCPAAAGNCPKTPTVGWPNIVNVGCFVYGEWGGPGTGDIPEFYNITPQKIFLPDLECDSCSIPSGQGNRLKPRPAWPKGNCW